jgi:thiol-disulfide isomerase/thioredoxin
VSGPHTRGWLHEFRNEIRWTVVVVVLAVLAGIALWPRDLTPEVAAPGTAPSVSESSPVDPVKRREARLPPCPAPAPTPPRTSLAGASATCMADGAPVDVGAALAGRPTLINVWATWCAPCRRELPALQAYSAQPGAIQVLGVQVLSDQSAGLDLLTKLGVRIPAVYDGNKRVSTALSLPNVLPASYVVTATGEVRRIDPPVVFESPDEVRAAVQRTLEGTT